MQSTRSHRQSPTRVNLWFDLALFTAILFSPAVAFTGLAIHEWLGIGLAAAILVHLLLHWQWIAQVTRRFFSHLPRSSRINYILNSLFFIDMTLIIFTGLLISRVALPLFGLQMGQNHTWEMVHRLSSDVMVFILALHVALHWRWIANALKRTIWQPVANSLHRKPALPNPSSLPKEGAL